MSDQEIADRIHELQHADRVERLIIQPQDLARHRIRAKTDKGTDCQIIIPRDQSLADGAVLFLETDRAVVVRIDEQRWLTLVPTSIADAIELGFFCGNLHWRVKFSGSELRVALEGPESDYLDRLRPLIERGAVHWVDND